MRGILAAHQLPPTQHLCQSMNIEWPPPPAFGIGWGRRGAGEPLMFICLIDIFSSFFFLRAPKNSVSSVAKKVSGLQ